MLHDSLDLKGLRENAGLSPAELARRLDLHQSQVSRYEQNPDNVPYKVYRAWLAACGEVQSAAGLDVGSPFAGLPERLASLRLYGRNQPPLEPGDTVGPAVGIEDLQTALSGLGRKPRLVLSGRFDAGKSRLANAIMGSDRLPSAYRPATRIVCLVRHTEDKPEWQREDVWIMGEGFDLNLHNDRQHCEQHRLLAGDFETLARFGTHMGRSECSFGEPTAALVHVDAPILRACEIIDTPGLTHDERDDALSLAVWARGDVLIYLSPINGFLNGEDLRALGTLVQALPASSDEPPLRRLMVLATHVHPGIRDDELNEALDAGADRAARELSRQFAGVPGADIHPIDAVALRARFFPWWAEDGRRRSEFELDLRSLVGNELPTAVRTRLDGAVQTFRTQASASLLQESKYLRNLLDERSGAEHQLGMIRAAEPERKHRFQEQRQRIEGRIARSKIETQAFVAVKVAELLQEERVRQFIEDRYKDSKNAEQHAANALLAEVQSKVSAYMEAQAKALAKEVDGFLDGYAWTSPDKGVGTVGVPFDARSAFLAALATGGTFGALSTWAAVAAGGSNLGAYVLVPQVVGLLARLGIGIAGGTAWGVSMVTALGGPAAIGIGIALSVGLLAWQIFGRSWQSRLARQITEHLASKEVDFPGKVQAQCDMYWDRTLKSFNLAADKTEEDHHEYIRMLEKHLGTPNEQIQEKLARVEARRAFLTYMPWTPFNEGDQK